MLRLEKTLFGVLIALALSIIILPKFYITGDGPSHTYNARILFDFLNGTHRSFYESYYTVNRNIDPNWTSHILIGLLLKIVPYWLADKMVQVLYLLLFTLSFRYFIASLQRENTFLSFLFFPFLFTLAFQEGFYNFSIGMACMLFTCGYYFRNSHQTDQPDVQLFLTLALLITSLSHGMTFLFAMALIVLSALLEYRHLFFPLQGRKTFLFLCRLLLPFVPGLLLVVLFLLKRGTHIEPHPWLWTEKLVRLFTGYASMSTRHAEIFPATACSVLLLLFLLFRFLHPRLKRDNGQQALAYVFLSMTLLTALFYLFCPQSIGGAGSLDIRLAFLPWMFLLFYLATGKWTENLKLVFMGFSFFISCTFLIIRFPYVLKASRTGIEIMQAADYIHDTSLVLNLHMDYWQQLPGHDSLFHQDGSFLHFSDYLGAMKNKHLILLNNYEAEINYFPINWQPGKNLRNSVPGFIQGELPPCGDYHQLEKQLGRPVDYVLFQNWRADALQQTCFQTVYQTIQQAFTLVYDSPHHAVKVYRHR